MKNNNMLINEKQEEVIRKDNKKARKSFIIIMLICLIAGGFFGFFSVIAGRKLPEITEVIRGFMADNAEILSIILSAVMLIITAAVGIWCVWRIGYSKEKAAELMEKDDDAALEKVERALSYDIWITNGLVILQFLYFSAIVFIYMNFLASRENVGLLMCAAAIFIIGALVMVWLQQKQIDCVRFLNPEKRGSVYDMNFHKKWEESCDEAELFIIYKAAYKAYRVVNILYIILWAFFMLMGLTTGAGFLPILTIMILWAVSTMVYSYYSMK